MKNLEYTIEVRVELKKGALDAEGETVSKSLNLLGYEVSGVQTIKVYRIRIDAENEKEALEKIGEASVRLLANPVIQEFELTVV